MMSGLDAQRKSNEPIIERYLDGSKGTPLVSSVSTILVGMGVLHGLALVMPNFARISLRYFA